MNDIVKFADLIKLSKILSDNGFSNKGISIAIEVKNKTILNKINEDIFFRNGGEGKVDEVDEIDINVNGVNFKYIIKEE
jgi:hypothetical protein